nr:hypothetical protein [Microbacterium sp. 18062]
MIPLRYRVRGFAADTSAVENQHQNDDGSDQDANDDNRHGERQERQDARTPTMTTGTGNGRSARKPLAAETIPAQRVGRLARTCAASHALSLTIVLGMRMPASGLRFNRPEAAACAIQHRSTPEPTMTRNWDK